MYQDWVFDMANHPQFANNGEFYRGLVQELRYDIEQVDGELERGAEHLRSQHSASGNPVTWIKLGRRQKSEPGWRKKSTSSQTSMVVLRHGRNTNIFAPLTLN